MLKKFKYFLSKNCYEILVITLLLHLYGSLFFSDLYFYGTYIRILNTVFLYFGSTITFLNRKGENFKKGKIIIGLLFLLNFGLLFVGKTSIFSGLRDVFYLVFLALTLYNIAKFLISPHRFDKALIFASLSGYLLIIEIAVRSFMVLYKFEGNHILNNVDFSYHTKTFIDTVYYCTVTITSIGFGDILPIGHKAKILTSILGLTGQFYLVIVMGIIVSKFISSNQKK
ncbi:potassium channel family protein [Flavobacterium sp.]|uniref:potassium channel family protein n=1 Tax=Flavobacterium sp. TaxID=239 RepID=UPI0037500EEE